MPAAI